VIYYTRQIVFLAVVGISATALAQTAPAPAAAPAPLPTEPGAAPAEPAPPPPAPPPPAPAAPDAARIDEIEQTALIAARKHELLEEEAAKKAKEAPKVSVDDKGFSALLPDKSFVLRIRGLVQADGRFFADSDVLEATDTFLVRKFRPSLEGTLFGLIDFRLLPEFAGTVQILDGYVDLHPWEWLRLRAGKMKAPIGLERLQGDADRVFLEQALISNLSSQRDVGVQLWGDIAGGLVHYVAGIYNGAPDNTAADTDINHAKDFMGRLFIHPFRIDPLKDFGNLGIGVSAGTGNRKGAADPATNLITPSLPFQTGLSPFRTGGQNRFFQYLAPVDTTGVNTVFTHERATRINPQLYYYYEGIGLLAEYMWLKQGVQKGNTNIAQLTQQAAAVTASYTINGRENYDGTTPLVGFDRAKGAWGALVIAARWSWLKVDDATFPTYANPVASARSANAFGAAVSWVPRRTTRFAISYEQTRFEGGAGIAAMGMAPATITDRATEHVFIGRAQANF
jgi:phosphate-selective porin OprO and OprP